MVVFALEHRDELFADGELTPWTKQSVERNAQGKVSPVADYRDVDPSQFVVGLFGGSVAAHLALLAGDVLVEAIERRIPQVAGRVVLLNFGEGGYKQPQQLHGLIEMALLGIPFDTVINLDGVNEVALGAADCVRGHHPLMPSRRHLRTVAKTFRGDSLDWTLRTAEIVGHQQAAQRWIAGVSSRPVLRNSELAKAVKP